MQSIQASAYSYNDFNFSMQTSSGDKIDLSMFNEKTAEIENTKTARSQTTEISLSHSYGYSFKYEGNGIDAQDKKEIAQAMKTIQPMLEEYMQSVRESEEDPVTSAIVNKANEINSLLPKPQENNLNNFMKQKSLDQFDKLFDIKENQNERMLHQANKLFDALMKQMDRFELYM